MNHINKAERLKRIRKGIKEAGGVTALARHLNVSRWWIYQVLNGNGASERVLTGAETIIARAQQQKANA